MVKRDRREYSRKYYKKNKERILRVSNVWQDKNRARVIQNSREYRKNNRDKINKYYREKLKIEKRIQAWTQYHRKEILKERGENCEICGSKENLQLHHEEYIHDFDKIHILCRKHHEKLHKILRRMHES